MILDSIDTVKLNQNSYLELLRELDAAKIKALTKLKKEDDAVKKFIESKLYIVLKSSIISKKDKYIYYLKSFDGDYKDVITNEIFWILMKEGPYENN